jgi:hypothetical protein
VEKVGPGLDERGQVPQVFEEAEHRRARGKRGVLDVAREIIDAAEGPSALC